MIAITNVYFTQTFNFHEKMSKYQILQQLLEQHKELPAQGSALWLARRKFTIGGSEIATVMGVNPYNSVNSLVAEKTGLSKTPFTGNIATRWGRLFEQVTASFIHNMMQLQYKIFEFSSIPSLTIPHQAYSPDGISIANITCTEEIEESIYCTETKKTSVKITLNDYIAELLVLFEFKSPLKSIPSTAIPKHYIPQVQAGLAAFPMCDLAIFVNNCYRKCLQSQLDFNVSFDNQFHEKSSSSFDKVYAIGFIGFYQSIESYNDMVEKYNERYARQYDSDVDVSVASTNATDSDEDVLAYQEENTYNNHDDTILISSKDNKLDFGGAQYGLFNRLLELYEQGIVKVKYFPLSIDYNAVDNENNILKIQNYKRCPMAPIEEMAKQKILINNFYKQCVEENVYSIGILPFKLMATATIAAERDETFHVTASKAVKDTIDKIQTILNEPEHLRMEKYLSYFPKKITAKSKAADASAAAHVTDMMEMMSFL